MLHVWNFSEQLLGRELRVKSFTTKQLLIFFKQSGGVFLYWKHALIRMKWLHLHQICWKNRRQKFRKMLTPILKTLWLFGHKGRVNFITIQVRFSWNLSFLLHNFTDFIEKEYKVLWCFDQFSRSYDVTNRHTRECTKHFILGFLCIFLLILW